MKILEMIQGLKEIHTKYHGKEPRTIWISGTLLAELDREKSVRDPWESILGMQTEITLLSQRLPDCFICLG